MQIGAYADGHPLEYEETEHSLHLGSAPITFEQLRYYDAAGQIAWASSEWRTWALAQAPASSPTAGDPRALAVSPETTKVTGRRVGAFLLDIVFVNLIQLPLAFPLAAIAAGDSEIDAISRLLGLLIGGGYFITCEAVWGKTLGKAALGLCVVNLNGQRITFGQSLGRNAARYIDFLFFAVPAFVTMSGSPLHQRLGDKWAKTVVVRVASSAI